MERVRTEALSQEDEERFLEFIKNDSQYSRYYDGIFILFNTGLRISEFCGITISNINFKEGILTIDHVLQRTRSTEYVVRPIKVSGGIRTIPMTEEVKEAFRRIIANRPEVDKESVVDGHKEFLFLDKNGNPMVPQHWERYFELSVKKYNGTHENRLPKITPHTCRRTYCKKLVIAGVSPIIMAYLLGLSNPCSCLKSYIQIGEEEARRAMKHVDHLNTENKKDTDVKK